MAKVNYVVKFGFGILENPTLVLSNITNTKFKKTCLKYKYYLYIIVLNTVFTLYVDIVTDTKQTKNYILKKCENV